jgi:3-deoxy-D-manno-octulosonic-acid transferase
MIFSFFYTLVWHLALLYILPKMALQALLQGKYRTSFGKKWGGGFRQIEKEGRPLIWVHAVSLGETQGVSPVIKKLKQLPHAPKILLTSTTETAYFWGKRELPEADWHLFFPFDLPYVMARVMRSASPDLLLLMEGDFWYHFQTYAKKNGAKIALINGKISEKTLRRFKLFPFIARRLLSPLDLLCVQNKVYQDRFQALGIPSCVTGNIKITRPMHPPLPKKEGSLTLTLGSTHAPEEEIWLSLLPSLWQKFPDLKLYIAPRHPERFSAVATLLLKKGLPFSLWSEEKSAQIVLVNQMGVLRSCYQLSDLAFVGGSFTPHIGGHNLIEPCYFKVPVLYGPHTHSQFDLHALVQHYGAGIQVTQDALLSLTSTLLADPEKRERLGERGYQLVTEQSHSLERTFEQLNTLLN